MNLDDAFERCLALLHEAALDDARWPAASALVDEACGAVGNILVVSERSGDIHYARTLYRGEDRPERTRAYFEDYYPLDEAAPRHPALPGGRLIKASGLYTEEELKTSVAYNEGWRLMRGQNGLTSYFDQADGLRIVWGPGDPVGGGDWQSDRLRLAGRLLPHVRQFVIVRQAVAAAEALGTGLAGLLDNARIGVVHLDRGGRVVAANAPALAILRRGDGLADGDGMLRASAPEDDERLQALLRRALPRLWSAVPATGSMTLGRPSGEAPLGLHVSPVGDAAADFGARRVAVLVLVVDAARRPRVDPVRVAAAFGLTPSEGRAVALLAEGRPVLEIAAMTGWQASYVRRLLKRIYGKMGVSGQVSLVPRVLALDALPRD